MTTTVTRTIELVDISCGSCGVIFGLARPYYEARHADGGWFWCPNGHRVRWSETDADRLRQEKAALERRLANAHEDARSSWAAVETERRRHAATKGQLTKTRKRAAAGVCPCCHRTFQQVARHVASQHPDFDPEAEA